MEKNALRPGMKLVLRSWDVLVVVNKEFAFCIATKSCINLDVFTETLEHTLCSRYSVLEVYYPGDIDSAFSPLIKVRDELLWKRSREEK